MDVDEHVLQLIGALKGAVDDDGVNKKKLIQNVSDCFMRIKKEKKAQNILADQASEEIQDFQVKALVLLLLCVRRIRELPDVKNCSNFHSLIPSLPELSDSHYFSVVRSQKIYSLLFPVLSRLPLVVVQGMIEEYFHHTDEVTPLTLAISVELLKVLLYSIQNSYTAFDESQGNMESLNLLVKFLSSRNISNESQVMVKFSGYFFMYLFECLYLLLAAYAGRKMKDPDTFSCVEGWENLWRRNIRSEATCLSLIKEAIKSLLMMAQNNNREVTVDIWMTWSEQMLPPLVMVHQNHTIDSKKDQSRSMQLVICNIAFDILKILEAHPQLKESLETSDHQELLQFMQQVAADPNYDPDQDMTLEQLLQKISLKDEKQGKFMGLLVKKCDVLTTDEACICLEEHAAAVDNQMRVHLLQHCIQCLQSGKPCSSKALNVVLELATNLTPEELMSVIVQRLSAGLDNILMTSLFKTQLTEVFNQLAEEDTVGLSGRHVWLCLQSGRSVVTHAVRLAISMSGLVSVMSQTLADLPQVCQCTLPSGNSLLVSTLLEWQASELSNKEERQFISLVKNLMEVEGMLATEEVLRVMVEPYLVMEDGRNPEKLILPLELLKEVIIQDVDAVVRPGPSVVSLVMVLMHVLDAAVFLEGHRASVFLTLRSLAAGVLAMITDIIMDNQMKFEAEISLLKQMSCECNLHPWSIAHISKVLDAELCGDSYEELLMHTVIKLCVGVQQGHTPDSKNCATASEVLKGIPRSRWITALLQLLPHCSEKEWTAALFLTHHVFGSQHTVFPTLEVFQEVMHLVCASHSTQLSHPQETADPLPPVSIQHCFTVFASASMVFLKERFQSQNSKERFSNFAKIFRWWCCTVSTYSCSPELPTVFLAQLCGVMEDMVLSSKLGASPEEESEAAICDISKVSLSQERENDASEEHREELLGIVIDEVNGTQQKQNNVCSKQRGKNLGLSSSDTSGNFDITRNELERELEKMTFSILRFVHISDLLSSVASKLKKLYEI